MFYNLHTAGNTQDIIWVYKLPSYKFVFCNYVCKSYVKVSVP